MKPLLANSETSGISRFPSLEKLPLPVCHEGRAYPPAQLDAVDPLGVVHLLTPPEPPTVITSLRFGLLQLVSGLVLSWGNISQIAFVHESFHVDSGMYCNADSCVVGLFVVLQ
jgi:hypothetical protein